MKQTFQGQRKYDVAFLQDICIHCGNAFKYHWSGNSTEFSCPAFPATTPTASEPWTVVGQVRECAVCHLHWATSVDGDECPKCEHRPADSTAKDHKGRPIKYGTYILNSLSVK